MAPEVSLFEALRIYWSYRKFPFLSFHFGLFE